MGLIRYRSATGGLTAPRPLVFEPSAPADRWDGPVRFLTDPRTYSSSEEALLGLAGEPHVEIVGEPSGGGSGRMRTVPLPPGLSVSVSTALTTTLSGHCVEGFGIPVDRRVRVDRLAEPDRDPVLEEADRPW